MKITQDVRDYAAKLNDQEARSAEGATGSMTRDQGMAQMSAKFKEMGSEVYVDADEVAAVKKSNEGLG